jgi:hypothetical protein
VSENKIPFFNDSLKAFSSLILGSFVLGGVSLLLVFVGLSPAISSFFALLSITSFILGTLAVFLRQTAKVIVEGLGGTIRTGIPSSSGYGVYDFDASMDEKIMAGKLWPKDFELWQKSGQPSLKDFALSGNRSFQQWISGQQDSNSKKG